MKSILKTILPSSQPTANPVELPLDFKKLMNFNRVLSVRNGETFIQPEGERAVGKSLYVEAIEFNVGGEHVQLRTDNSPYFKFMLPLHSDKRTVVSIT